MVTKKKIVELEELQNQFDKGLLLLIKSVVGDVAKIKRRLTRLEKKK